MGFFEAGISDMLISQRLYLVTRGGEMPKHFRMIFLSLNTMLLLAGCIPLPIPADTNVVTVRGRVIDESTQVAIPGAQLSVDVSCLYGGAPSQQSTVGDAEGSFLITSAGGRSTWFYLPLLPAEGVWGSSVRVTVQADGYQSEVREDSKKGWQLGTRAEDTCRGEYDLGEIELRRK